MTNIVEAAKDMNRYEQGLFASEPAKPKRVWVSIFPRAYDDMIGIANDGTAWRSRGPTKPGTEQWVQIKEPPQS